MRIRAIVLWLCLAVVSGCFCLSGGMERIQDSTTLILTSFQADLAGKAEQAGYYRELAFWGFCGDESINLTASLSTIRQDRASLKRYKLCLERALLQSTVGECSEDRAGLLLAMADVLRREKKFDQAEIYAAEANKLAPFDHNPNGLLTVALIAADRGDVQRAEQLFQHAANHYEVLLPEQCMVQSDLAAVLEETARFKDKCGKHTEASQLKQRAGFLRDAQREGRISEIERPFYASIPWKRKNALPPSNIVPVRAMFAHEQISPDLATQLSNARIPALVVNAELEHRDGADQFIETTRIVQCSPFGVEHRGIKINDPNFPGPQALITSDEQNGCLVVSRKGELVLVEPNGKESKFTPPASDAAIGLYNGACLDSSRHRLLALGNNNRDTLFERSVRGGNSSWTPIANLSTQGVHAARGILSDKDHLYILEQNSEDQFVFLVKLNKDGIVLSKQPLSTPIFADSFHLTKWHDKIVLMQISNLPAVCQHPVETSWVIDCNTGGVLAHVLFDAKRSLPNRVQLSMNP